MEIVLNPTPTPPPPKPGKIRLYIKGDGNLYMIDSDGKETRVDK